MAIPQYLRPCISFQRGDIGEEQQRGRLTVMILGKVGAEVEQQIDDLRAAQFQRVDDDRTANELRVLVRGEADQVALINRVHLLITCPNDDHTPN